LDLKTTAKFSIYLNLLLERGGLINLKNIKTLIMAILRPHKGKLFQEFILEETRSFVVQLVAEKL